jgi:hypothetical protein
MKERILLGVTTYSRKRYILDKFLHSIKKIKAFTDHELDILFVDNSKDSSYAEIIQERGFNVWRSPHLETTHQRLTVAYNKLRSAFIWGNYDRLMIIEQDVIAPKWALNELLEHDVPIVSGVYYLGKGENLKPCVMKGEVIDIPVEERHKYMNEPRVFKYDFMDQEELKGKELIKVFACGLGCVLIKKEVLETLCFRVSKSIDGRFAGHNDMYFYMDLLRRKIPVYVDPNIVCEHHNDTYE